MHLRQVIADLASEVGGQISNDDGLERVCFVAIAE